MLGRDMYLHREMYQILMDLDFDPLFQYWGEFYYTPVHFMNSPPTVCKKDI